MRVPHCLVLGAMVCACQPAAPANTDQISAYGSGQVSVPATRARISLGTETHAATAALAAQRNDSIAGEILAALRGDRRCDSVRVLNVGVSPIRDPAGRLVGYAALAYIGFLTRALDSVGPLLTLAVRAGASSINRVAFESDSAEAGHARALEMAVARARTDAEILARASGVELGPLASMDAEGTGLGDLFEEAAISSDPSTAEFGNARGGGVALGPTPRSLRVSVSVSGRWRIRS